MHTLLSSIELSHLILAALASAFVASATTVCGWTAPSASTMTVSLAFPQAQLVCFSGGELCLLRVSSVPG